MSFEDIKWAVLDIETTGIDPGKDKIIDIGFLQFEGAKLVRKYQSLIHTDVPISSFITKLTGITQSMVNKAPDWEEVSEELKDLAGHKIIAHNAKFEESFLSDFFRRNIDEEVEFVDSLDFLAWCFPDRSSLSLESFIVDFELAEKEEHRGFQDSVDLLKVMICGFNYISSDRELFEIMRSLFYTHGLQKNFWAQWIELSESEILGIKEILDQDGAPMDWDSQWQFSEEEKVSEVQEDLSRETNFSEFQFDGKSIQSLYQDEDKMRELFSSYHYRSSQEQLSLKVGQCFKNQIHSLIQAPTGTGKTLGYLIPAALYTKNEGEQVLVATGTKALQNQAISKDVPALKKIMGKDHDQVKFTRLIGSSNHICESLFRQLLDKEDMFSERAYEAQFSKVFFELVFFHNNRRDYNTKITRDSLPHVLKMKFPSFRDMDSQTAVDFRSCTGFRCPFKHSCSYVEGLKEARESQIIIGNHALMFQWPKGIPRPLNIIVDEAHRTEHEATKSFSLEVSHKQLNLIESQLSHSQGIGSLFYLLAQNEEFEGQSTPKINELRKFSLESAKILKDHLSPLDEKVEGLFKAKIKYTDKYWNELPFQYLKEKQDPFAISILNHLDSIRFVLKGLVQELLTHYSRYEASQFKEEAALNAYTRFDSFYNSINDALVAMETALDLKEGFAHAFLFKEGDGFVISSAPVDVGRIIHDGLLENSQSVVFTSATLANALGDRGVRGVEWATGYTYLEPERRFRTGLFLPAIFDYKNQAKVYLCDDLPNLHDSSFVEKSILKISKVIEAIDGKTLLLFSARTRFEKALELILSKYEGRFPIFFQGMGRNVIEEFKASGNGILVGMESLGEGIDIPGESLQFVFIDKVPDMRMDLVVKERRDFYDANLGNEFEDYYLSHRARALHQKLGRLIRRETDYGGVLIADSRIKRWKSRTIGQFFDLMKPYDLKRENADLAVENITEFILSKCDHQDC
ncbi:MAG: helicase C-terminal domain-containing protein [Bacteriovoracaceae bacterium]